MVLGLKRRGEEDDMPVSQPKLLHLPPPPPLPYFKPKRVAQSLTSALLKPDVDEASNSEEEEEEEEEEEQREQTVQLMDEDPEGMPDDAQTAGDEAPLQPQQPQQHVQEQTERQSLKLEPAPQPLAALELEDPQDFSALLASPATAAAINGYEASSSVHQQLQVQSLSRHKQGRASSLAAGPSADATARKPPSAPYVAGGHGLEEAMAAILPPCAGTSDIKVAAHGMLDPDMAAAKEPEALPHPAATGAANPVAATTARDPPVPLSAAVLISPTPALAAAGEAPPVTSDAAAHVLPAKTGTAASNAPSVPAVPSDAAGLQAKQMEPNSQPADTRVWPEPAVAAPWQTDTQIVPQLLPPKGLRPLSPAGAAAPGNEPSLAPLRGARGLAPLLPPPPFQPLLPDAHPLRLSASALDNVHAAPPSPPSAPLAPHPSPPMPIPPLLEHLRPQQQPVPLRRRQLEPVQPSSLPKNEAGADSTSPSGLTPEAATGLLTPMAGLQPLCSHPAMVAVPSSDTAAPKDQRQEASLLHRTPLVAPAAALTDAEGPVSRPGALPTPGAPEPQPFVEEEGGPEQTALPAAERKQAQQPITNPCKAAKGHEPVPGSSFGMLSDLSVAVALPQLPIIPCCSTTWTAHLPASLGLGDVEAIWVGVRAAAAGAVPKGKEQQPTGGVPLLPLVWVEKVVVEARVAGDQGGMPGQRAVPLRWEAHYRGWVGGAMASWADAKHGPAPSTPGHWVLGHVEAAATPNAARRHGDEPGQMSEGHHNRGGAGAACGNCSCEDAFPRELLLLPDSMAWEEWDMQVKGEHAGRRDMQVLSYWGV